MFRRLKNPQGVNLTDFYQCWKLFGFLTIPRYSLEEAHQLVLIQKITFGALETPSASIFKLLETSRADWDKNPKVGDQELEKCEGGVVGFREPYFWNEKKTQGVRCEKSFENWKRVSGSKLHVFTTRFKRKWPKYFRLRFPQFNRLHVLIPTWRPPYPHLAEDSPSSSQVPTTPPRRC